MEILSLGEKVKRRRKELNMTLKDLAGDRITPGQISLVETGKSNPSMDLLEYLASSLNVSVEYLMESEEHQAEMICEYYENIAESYILNSDMNSAEKYIEISSYYAEKYNIEYRKGKSLYLRAQIHIYREEYALAQQLLLSANVFFVKLNAFDNIVNTYLDLGKITYILKAYYSSNCYFQQAEKVFMDNNVKDDFKLAIIYYNIAMTFFKLDNVEKAMNYSFLSKEKFNALDNKEQYAKSLMLLAEEYNKKGDISSAIKYSQSTLKILNELNETNYVAEVENSLGKLFYEFNNIEESFKHFNKAKEIRERNKDGKISETLVCLCENYLSIKDIDKCKDILKKILDNISDGDNFTIINYYLLKYRVHLMENNSKEAENTLHIAFNFAKNMECYKNAAEIAIMIGKFYIDNGEDTMAAKYLNEGVELLKTAEILKD
ncbi:helix-turn-helix domain-containing protein [Clostridium oryzae]|uniref:Anaerobic benzoate catabolism transcriptional regulator n=1 Tax=Clostridium oryzae TaxID=1450648 RepID=A0A1V4IH51_9CLOT|nr:helix-turn-helix domain-containing protein [Clostridium oryzae]OPJ59005.1 anaerobic benzoate catabolism transcriptional regulator [Clostridium oryzae]